MQSIDTHPTFIRQTVASRQARLAAEAHDARLARVATTRLVNHGAAGNHGAPGSHRATTPRRGWFDQIARRVRSAFGATA
jgi:hypothetical protein